MAGPLPDPNRRRRNAPTIPTTQLPISGTGKPAPELPTGYDLRVEGSAWWLWAWAQPQAAAWSSGDLYVAARRAALEDDLAALRRVDVSFDLADLLDDDNVAERVKALVERLKALAGGKLSVLRECREIDDRLGLTPKGLAALRWTIVDDPGPAKSSKPKGRRAGLRVVDAAG